MDRIEYFHDAVQTVSEPLSDSEMGEIIMKYVRPCSLSWNMTLIACRCIHRDGEEIAELEKERRKGRPPSKREEILKQRTQTEEKELKTGFWLPDLGDPDVLLALKHWNGEWSGLSAMKFIRFSQEGGKRSSTFPPKGMS